MDKEGVRKLSVDMDQNEVTRFLKGWGIHIEEWKVRLLVMALPCIIKGEEGYSLRSFYRDSQVDSHISKKSCYKIKKLFEACSLDQYLDFLDATRDWHPTEVAKNAGNQLVGSERQRIFEDIWQEASKRVEDGERGTFYAEFFREVSRRIIKQYLIEVFGKFLKGRSGQPKVIYFDANSCPLHYQTGV